MSKKQSFLLRMIRSVLVLTLVVLGLGLIALWYSGAWHVVFPSSEHDIVAPYIPTGDAQKSVLVFSKTNGFRHDEGIAAGTRTLQSIARNNGWDIFATENGAVFNADILADFDSVVFLNTTGDTLNMAQQRAFRSWLEAGGGWVGIHAAGDDSHADWGWYVQNLIGAKFTAHIMGPQFQRATVVTESIGHPAVDRLPNIWQHSEEWYSWEQTPRVNGFNILAVLDEDSYTPVQNFLGRQRDLRMGDHPVIWSRCVGKGRALYSALGHKAESFDSSEHRLLLEDALRWTLGLSASEGKINQGCE
ncbi:MAG: ThuA domain-containing protein [Halioglobus sp.]